MDTIDNADEIIKIKKITNNNSLAKHKNNNNFNHKNSKPYDDAEMNDESINDKNGMKNATVVKKKGLQMQQNVKG